MGSESVNGALFSPESKKMIQSLKEVVNNSDAEIYAVLKECNMNPDEAVDRLLSLDSFHEVKSKRERRKEMKETLEFRSHVNNGGSNRGVTEHIAGLGGSTQSNYDELGEPAYKGQEGFAASSPHSSNIERTINPQPSSHSDSSSTSTRSGDSISAIIRPSAGNQSAWSITSSEQLSMADIVKMGINPSKESQISSETPSLHQDGFETNTFNHNVESSRNSGATGSSALNANVDAHNDRSKLYNASNVLRDYQSDKVSEVGFSSENQTSDQNASDRAKIVDASGVQTYNVHLSSNSSSYGSHRCTSENEEGKAYPSQCISDDLDVPSATVNMQQLSFINEKPKNHCVVILPSHLKKLAADCKHLSLSFGSFKSGNDSVSRSQSFKNVSGGAYAGMDSSFPGHSDTRNSAYNHDELHGRRAGSGMSSGRKEQTLGHMPSLHSDMAYQGSLQRDLLESRTPSVRGSDLPYSQLGTSSMPSRYRSAASSVNGPTISMYESTRALPSVQDRAYNNLHGQNQHYAGYRQEQSRQVPSQSQHYESMGYPNYFTSQLGTTHEHQGQRLNDSHFRPGIPDLPPQEWQQLWSRKY